MSLNQMAQPLSPSSIDVEDPGILDTAQVFHLVKDDGTVHKMQGFGVSKTGLKSSSHPAIGISMDDMVGVHRDGKTVRFVGYSMSNGRWCGSNGLVREEVRVVAAGPDGDEANESAAENLCLATMRYMDRTEKSMEKPLLVFINPKSGPGKSVSIWNNIGNKVIQEDGGHKVEVVTTTRQNHALDYIKDHADPCSAFKGIVIVSGDGLVYEVIQGMMSRKDWAHCVRKIPIGILPGGSGNGLAKSISDDCRLPHSSLSSAVIVAKQKTQPLDICAVDIGTPSSGVKRLYSFLSLEWAIASDIDIGSEYMRFLGETRFTIEAIKRLLFLRKYRGRLSFLPVEDGKKRSAKECETPPTYWEEHGDQIDSTSAESPHLPLLPKIGEAIPEEWTVVEDIFWNLWNCNVSWMSGSSKIAPEAHFADGFIQLSYLRENGPEGMSKGKLLSYLLGLDSGEHQTKTFCEMSPTRAYRFEPLPNPDGKLRGTIALDGEVVDYTSLQMQNLRGFMKIFSGKSSL